MKPGNITGLHSRRYLKPEQLQDFPLSGSTEIPFWLRAVWAGFPATYNQNGCDNVSPVTKGPRVPISSGTDRD